MNIILAPDSFKGSLSATEVAESMARGVQQVFPQAEIIKLPFSDGGEGLVHALVNATGGEIRKQKVTGPLGEEVLAFWGVLGDRETAVIEMAAASGLLLVPEEKRKPLITTTYGTGELIKAALSAGFTRLIIGIGGSATNDGGAGMAQALGASLTDHEGNEIPFGGAALARLAHIDTSRINPLIKDAEILVACDVNNPLTGPTGASAIYGPQKGATAEMVAQLDESLKHYAQIILRDLNIAVEQIPGAGAAGGLGAGIMAFLGGSLRSGIDLVMDTVGFTEKLANCDLIITGEGKLDAQSAYGKVPVGVARKAKEKKVPVVVLAGSVETTAKALHQEGVTAFFSICTGPMKLEQSISQTVALLEHTTEEVLRLCKGTFLRK
ncbi:glycerate kinase family protein [Dethiobacter alkaliphilus]|uniref:glycerate kinase family protein n=1 Tax=Dethiobacter alkaliphilus TaxID=427926 RepID=UPI002225BDFD|nr:glycerate kinase [Dethiobacter alkaliphilus]MCW3489454.1 glycerate kinase [Dethiobacter alkaliphilus]